MKENLIQYSSMVFKFHFGGLPVGGAIALQVDWKSKRLMLPLNANAVFSLTDSWHLSEFSCY